MAKEFRLPDIGEGVSEGEITKWLVKEGDRVTEDQPLVEVMTDKVTVEIPSPFRGVVVKRAASEGSTVKVGEVLVVIGEEGERVTKEPPAGGQPKVEHRVATPGPQAAASAEVETQRPPPLGKPLATPAVRKLAREMSVDLSRLKGTGPHGRTTEGDVRTFAARGPSSRPETSAPPTPQVEVQRVERGERTPIRGLRKRIWEHMAKSEQHIAPFTYVDEVDVSELVALRDRMKGAAEREGVKLTFLPFVVKAVVAGLKEFPSLNATIDEEHQELIIRQEYNVGIATATDEGLIVPVVKDADRRSLLDIAKEVERLAKAARDGKLQLPEIQGGTFTITSLGAAGGLLATPIVNHPEVAILGIHEIKKRPVVDENDKIVIRSMMNISCTFDHRVIDGHVGAAFTKEVARFLSDPAHLLIRGV